MSVQLIGWALEQRTGSVSRKAVLLTLANASNGHTGLCCPSLTRLAEETELSRSTVKRALDDLEAAGFIERVNRTRGNGSVTSNEYRFPRFTENPPQVHSEPSPRVMVNPPEPEVRTRSRTIAAEPQNGVAEKIANSVDPPHNGRRPKPTRAQRDEVWDTLTDIFGPALTRSAETLRGKHVASLAEAGATRDEIERRARSWPNHFDTATLTAAALEKHWDTLGRKPLRRRS